MGNIQQISTVGNQLLTASISPDNQAIRGTISAMRRDSPQVMASLLSYANGSIGTGHPDFANVKIGIARLCSTVRIRYNINMIPPSSLQVKGILTALKATPPQRLSALVLPAKG